MSYHRAVSYPSDSIIELIFNCLPCITNPQQWNTCNVEMLTIMPSTKGAWRCCKSLIKPFRSTKEKFIESLLEKIFTYPFLWYSIQIFLQLGYLTPEKTYIMKIPHCFKVSIIQAINWKSTDLFRSTFSWLFAYVVWLYISIRWLPRKEEIISILEIRGKYLIKLWCHFVSTTNTNETGSLLPVMVLCISSFQLLLTYKPLMIMEMIGQIYLMMISLILSFAKDFQEFYFLDSAMKSYVQPCTLTK